MTDMGRPCHQSCGSIEALICYNIIRLFSTDLAAPMNFSRLALCIAAAICAAPVFAGDAPPAATTPAPEDPQHAVNLGGVDVDAKLDAARNSLSPDTGSSQYVLDS